MADTPTKVCNRCNVEQDACEFGARRPACNSCRSARTKARHAERMLTDPAYVEKKRQSTARYRRTDYGKSKIRENKSSLEYRAKAATAQAQRRTDPEHNAKRILYRSNPAVRARESAARKIFRKNNLEFCLERDRAVKRHRRALKGKISQKDWLNVKNLWRGCCAYCGCNGDMSMDHVVPVSKGGPHDILNIAPACRPCNASKSNKELAGTRERLAAGLPALTPEMEVCHR